jgi:fucose permease
MLNRIGYKKGIFYGLLTMALGALMFIPAAFTRAYLLFLTGLFMLGIGLAVLQTAGNPFVTIIGPIESAAKRMSIMGVCNKFAGIIAPLLLGMVIIKSTDSQLFSQLESGAEMIDGVNRTQILDELIRRVILPYSILAVALIGFAFYVKSSILPDIDTNKGITSAKEKPVAEKKYLIQYPWLVLGVIGMICHLGTQILCINTLTTSAQALGTDIAQAKNLPPMILFTTFIGFGLGVMLIPKILTQLNSLKIAATLNLLASVAVVFVGGKSTILGIEAHNALWILIIMGIPNAFLYSGIWPLTIHGLGKFTGLGSALLVMALSSSGFFPLIYAQAVKVAGVQTAYWMSIPCFLFLVFFAFYGYKITSWKIIKK